MRFFEQHAPDLAAWALDAIDFSSCKDEVTHLIIACCTGFYAPGIDIDIVNRFGLKASVERTIVGFMGCYAAMNALKLAPAGGAVTTSTWNNPAWSNCFLSTGVVARQL
jgi:predicted naringenin-chalcone synthase